MAPIQKCLHPEKFIELEWKMKGNNELTLLQMKIMSDDIKEIKDTLHSFIKEMKIQKEKDENDLRIKFEECSKTYIKTETVRTIFIVFWIAVTILTSLWWLIVYLHPLIK